jgi:hypothetical protein
MHRHTLRLQETVLGKAHLDTYKHEHAESLRQQGKYAEAEVMHRHIMQLRETVLG